MKNKDKNLIGEMFKIYQKPRTKEGFEGEAKVVRVHARFETEFDAEVQFAEDGKGVCTRRFVNFDDQIILETFKVTSLRHYQATYFVKAQSAEEASEKVAAQNGKGEWAEHEFVDEDTFEAEPFEAPKRMTVV